MDNTKNNKNIPVSTDCKTDSQCFPNICIDNFCKFTKNNIFFFSSIFYNICKYRIDIFIFHTINEKLR